VGSRFFWPHFSQKSVAVSKSLRQKECEFTLRSQIFFGESFAYKTQMEMIAQKKDLYFYFHETGNTRNTKHETTRDTRYDIGLSFFSFGSFLHCHTPQLIQL
jgi:hypothetical protein